MLIRKKIFFLRPDNVFSAFIAGIILYTTIFSIYVINHAYSQTLSSRDPESTNVAKSIKEYDQLTQDIIRTNLAIKTNKNRTSHEHDINNVSQVSTDNSNQFNNTGNVLIAIPDVKLKINKKKQVTNVTDVNRTITNKESVKVDKNLTKLHGNYKGSINNKTELVNVTDIIQKKQETLKPRDIFQDVHLTITMVQDRVVVNQMLSNWTENDTSSLIHKRQNLCALWPDKLVKLMNMEVVMNTTGVPDPYRKLIAAGGVFRPIDCSPRERTAIIIPYRDREKNLQVLLAHLHRVLQRQMIEYGIFVIELAFPTQFNRGLLANVGFLTASSIHSYTCYIIHDVDLLMMDDRNMYRCGRVPRHLTASNTKYSTGFPYMTYFGGIEAFTPQQFWKVNGFSNLYFGWGGEDDDMVYRIFYTGQHFSRPQPTIGGYTTSEHSPDQTNPVNPNRGRLLETAKERMSEDGLSSVMYQRLALEFKPLYTWVYISTQEAQIMLKYQHYLIDRNSEKSPV